MSIRLSRRLSSDLGSRSQRGQLYESILSVAGTPRNFILPETHFTYSDQAGTTPIANTQSVEYVRDQGSANLPLLRGAGASRPTWNSGQYLTLSGSNYLGAGTSADFKSLHDGTGSSLYLIVRGIGGAGEHYFSTTLLPGLNGAGILCVINANGQITWQIRNATSFLLNFTATATGQSNAWTILCLQFTPTKWLLWQDGCNRRNTTYAGTPSTGNSDRLFNLGYSASNPANNADFGGMILYNSVHTPAQVRSVMRSISECTVAAVPTNHVVFVGDSTSLSYPTVCMSLKGASWRGVNRAINGNRSDQAYTNQYLGDGTAAQYGRHSHMVIMLGINDVGQNYPAAGTSGTTCANNISTMVDDFLLREAKKVVLAVMPMPSADGITPSFDTTQRAQYAALLAAVQTKVASDPTRIAYADVYTLLGGGVGAMQPAYTTDGTHPNSAGEAILAQAVANALTA